MLDNGKFTTFLTTTTRCDKKRNKEDGWNVKPLLKGCDVYQFFFLFVCLMIEADLTHGYMPKYQPNIKQECPKDFVSHRKMCCSYIRCDPGFQVRTCSINLTADTCEMCPYDTMTYFPTDSRNPYKCKNVQEECPKDTRPVSFIATEKDPQACSKRCQCNTMTNYCGTNPCKCRIGQCEKHYQLQQDCGCRLTSHEMRSTHARSASKDKSNSTLKKLKNPTTISAFKNQISTSTTMILNAVSSKSEFSSLKSTRKAKATTRSTAKPRPPVVHDEQKNNIPLLVITTCTFLLLLSGLAFFCKHIKGVRKPTTIIENQTNIEIENAENVLIGNDNEQNINTMPLLSTELNAEEESRL